MRRRFGRWLLVALAVGCAGWALVGFVSGIRAQSTLDRLAVRYGRGCVAYVAELNRAVALDCPVGGIQAGHIVIDGRFQTTILFVEGLCREEGKMPGTKLALDAYGPGGDFLETSAPLITHDAQFREGRSVAFGILTPPKELPPTVFVIREATAVERARATVSP